MVLFKRLAGCIVINANSGSSSIIAQRTPAVEDRGHADPLQRLRVPEQTEVVEVAILIGNEVVQHDHLILQPTQGTRGATGGNIGHLKNLWVCPA